MKRFLLSLMAAVVASSAAGQTQQGTEVIVTTPDIAAGDDQEDIATKAKDLLVKVVNDATFLEKVRNAKYPGGTFFRDENGKTIRKAGKDVESIIKTGLERGTKVDNKIQIVLRPKPQPKKVVGSTKLGSNHIRTATWFIEQCAKRNDATSLARHLIHEWLHAAGFFHKGSGPAQGDVPYEVGDILREVAQSYPKDLMKPLGLDGYMIEDDLAASFLEEAEDEVEFESPRALDEGSADPDATTTTPTPTPVPAGTPNR